MLSRMSMLIYVCFLTASLQCMDDARKKLFVCECGVSLGNKNGYKHHWAHHCTRNLKRTKVYYICSVCGCEISNKYSHALTQSHLHNLECSDASFAVFTSVERYVLPQNDDPIVSVHDQQAGAVEETLLGDMDVLMQDEPALDILPMPKDLTGRRPRS